MGDNMRGTRVYVGNLTDDVKKEDLEEEFIKYGKLNSVWVAFNPPGFAFVEFESRDDAERACDILDGIEILGSKLRVEISKGRRDGPGRRFRGGTGGRGGFRDSRESGFRSEGGRFVAPRNNSIGGGFRSRGGRGGHGYDQSNGFGGGGDGYSRNGGFGGSRDGGRYRGTNGGGGRDGGRFRSRSPRSGRGRI